MGFIRGALVTITSILLFVSLFSTAGLLTISMSLDYNVIKPEIKNIINEVGLEQTGFSEHIDEAILTMQLYCQNTNVTTFSYNIEQYNFNIPCEIINQGSEAVVNYALDDFVEDTYYKEYDCEFTDCFAQESPPLFLLSKHSQDYWYSWFYIALIVSVALAVLLFFFMQSKTNYPFLLGALFIVVSLPFLLAGKLVSTVVGWEYAQILGSFFTQAYTVFLIFIVLGVISLGIGIVLKFLSIGRFFGNLFKKDDKVTKKDLKEAVEEIKKPKKKKK